MTVSLDEALVKELAGASRERQKPRSHLVEEALRMWRRSRLEQALRDGYEAMAREDRATAERRLAAAWETMK